MSTRTRMGSPRRSPHFLGLLCLPLATVLLAAPSRATQEEERLHTDRPGVELLTVPEEDDAFTFAVFGDRTGGPASGVEILAQAVKDVNLVEPDLVMTVGDLVEGYNEEALWLTQMAEYKGIMDGLTSPWYPVAGNHDVYWLGSQSPRGGHEANYEANFGPLWYALRHKDCWFISLYTDEGDPQTGEKSFSKPRCQRMSPEQLAFLDETLTRAADARHIFIFLHHPRWMGGAYGDDWEQVHQRLVAAGNVTAVFAGHIHRMVHSGTRDGIEYMTLATVGGGQSGISPEAGFLHHWNLVTVRDGHIAVATFPVGAAMDPRKITLEVSSQVRALSQGLELKVLVRPTIDVEGGVDGQYLFEVANPLSTPIDVQLTMESEDSRWLFLRGEHHHAHIEGGERARFRTMAMHSRARMDRSLRLPRVQLQADYLGTDMRISLPARAIDLPLPLNALAAEHAPPRPPQDHALVLNGRDNALLLADDLLKLPDGPFTLECWMRAEEFGERTGLITKTEGSEFGIFVNNGQPSFSVHLGTAYATAKAELPLLKVGTWHHLAGVFDGSEVRLYVDGRQVAAVPGSGERTRNSLPLVLGGDVDPEGNPTSFFHGALDEVHLSAGVRYEGETFAPLDRVNPDAHSKLLLHFDGFLGYWVIDHSPEAGHPLIWGTPGLGPR